MRAIWTPKAVFRYLDRSANDVITLVHQFTSARLSELTPSCVMPESLFGKLAYFTTVTACPAGGDGSDIGDRINPMVNAMGCRKRGGISENVAQNRPGSSAKTYFDQWWGSAGHKKNILGRDATHMGVAVASNGRKEYATQVFAECR